MEHRNGSIHYNDSEDSDTVTEEVALTLNENLAKKSLPYLSSKEQIHLVDLVDCVAQAEKQRRSMDENATRFSLFFRQHVLRSSQIPNRQLGITWRETAWAFHSGSQDILVDLVNRHYQGKMRWKNARDCGIFMWITDMSALVSLRPHSLILLLTLDAESAARGHRSQ